ncbi:MAG: hypothetical protein R3326_00450 [Gemmatimonadota bacterium]|nr:hypothetical protein [Gemmatimonadota bacterium]
MRTSCSGSLSSRRAASRRWGSGRTECGSWRILTNTDTCRAQTCGEYWFAFEKTTKGKAPEWHEYRVCEAGADPTTAVRYDDPDDDLDPMICSDVAIAPYSE